MEASPRRLERGARFRTAGRWINLHTTDHCNLSCSYCYYRNKQKREPSYDLEHLKRLVDASGARTTFCFYGGEPTLNIPYMQRVMGELGPMGASFAIQTNGTLLHKLPEDMLRSFVGVGISVDGGEEVTDHTRGKGVFARIIDNVAAIRDVVRVPILARMTLTERNELDRDIDILMQHFGAVYWQLDNDLSERPHADFLTRYKAALPRLIDRWIAQAEAGNLVNLVPIIGVYWKLTRSSPKEQAYYHCEPGRGALTIDAGGTIYSCPEGVFRGREETGGSDILGHLEDTQGRWPRLEHEPKSECVSCDIRHICGGRCIWTHAELYCDASRALVQTVEADARRIWKQLNLRTLKEMFALVLTTELMP